MWDSTKTCIICIVLIIGMKSVEASKDNATIHLVIFHEESDSLASLGAAIEYIKQNSDGSFNIGEVTKIFAHSDDAIALITKVCRILDELNSGVTRPDLALDFTRTGIPSEAIKVLAKELRIPTIAAAFGEIREWQNISEPMRKYLIHVPPPADVVIESLRGFALKQNMTTAALLHDEQFIMPIDKYKTLLKDVPTKHLLRKLDLNQLREQMIRVLNMGMLNIFIAGSAERISSALTEASTLLQNPTEKENTILYSMSLDNRYPDCGSCRTSMKVYHLTPQIQDHAKSGNKRTSFLSSRAMIDTNNLTQIFYFDLAVDAITAVRSLKSKDLWNEHKAIYCKSFNMSEEKEDVSISLIDAFREVQSENFLGPFNLEGNGKNFPRFNMNIELLEFESGSSTPFSIRPIGNWQSGFGGGEQLVPLPQGKKTPAPPSSKTQSLESSVVQSNSPESSDMQLYSPQMQLAPYQPQMQIDSGELPIHSPRFHKIVVHVQPPFVYQDPKCDDKGFKALNTECYYGYAIDLMQKIRKTIPFDYKIHNVSGQGYIDEDSKKWDGMVREIIDGEADFGLGAFALMTEREAVVDVTYPIFGLTGFQVVMRVDRTKYDLFKFLSVLESDVWFCIVAAFFFTSGVMWFFERYSPYSYRNAPEKYEDEDDKRTFTLRECMWFCMTSLTPQGGGEAPKNLSGRLVAATWWLFGFIIIASYTANLAAFLTVSRLDKPIENFEDLITQYRVHYSPVKHSPAWIYFDRMAYTEHRFYEAWKDISLNDSLSAYERSKLAVWNYPVSDKYTKIWQVMQENGPPGNISEALFRMRGNDTSSEAFALITETTDARYLVLMNCEFKVVGDQFALKPYVIPVTKGSPLKEEFSKIIHGLEKSRWLEWLNEKWWKKNRHRPFCPRIDIISEGISKEDIGGCFIVMISGVILAHLWLLPEYIYYRIWKKIVVVADEMKEIPLDNPPNPTSATMRTDFSMGNTDTNFKTEYNRLPSVQTNSWS